MKRTLLIAVLLLAVVLLTGCAQSDVVPVEYRWASVEGGQINQQEAGEEFYFSIFIDEAILTPEITPVRIRVSGAVQQGSLRFELRRPDGSAVWNSGTIGPGDFSINTEYMPDAQSPGTYKLGLMYGENTTASYNLAWHSLAIGPMVLVSGSGMVLVALAFVGYSLRRRLGVRYLLLGALFWVLTVALKFAFAIPVNPLVYQALGVTNQALFSPGNLLAYLYVGLLTGVFEAGVAWAILRKVRWGQATWNQALAFGIGFGAVEALLLGLSAFGSAALALTQPDALPVVALGSLAQASRLEMGLAPVVERLTVIIAHIFACLLIFTAIARREAKWGWLAVLYKTLLDAPAAFAQFWGINTPGRIWTIEAVLVVMALIGLWGIFFLARRYPNYPPGVQPSEVAPVEVVPV